MENIEPSYELWNELALKVSIVFFAFGGLLLLGYLVKLVSTSDSKSKYDFIVKYETKLLWLAALIIFIGGGLLANSAVSVLTPVWVFARLFSTFSMILIAALTTQNLLKFYYPFYIEKRLKALRHKPRISPRTGKPMKLLSEEEEDAYLDEGMQAEENLFSTDYDVWKDEESGYIKIEKYAGHLLATECPECSYQTLKIVREEIIKKPEGHEHGELVKYYSCVYCDYRISENVRLLGPYKFDGTSPTLKMEQDQSAAVKLAKEGD